MAFRVGIIGCGRMADTIEDEQVSRRKKKPYRGGLALPYSHAAGYAAVKETEVVAACDIRQERLNEFSQRWNVSACYTNYRQMIEEQRLDIVSVTTRPEHHAEQMIFAANQGVKGIYAEKPLCMTLEETDAICQAFECNGTHLEYGPIYRHWAVYEQARIIVEGGELGEIKSVLAFEGKALEGHFIDLLLYLLGDPKPVSMRGIISDADRAETEIISKITNLEPLDDETRFTDASLLLAQIEFDNDTTAYVAQTGVGREVELVCSNGTIRVCNDGEFLQVRHRDTVSGAFDIVPVESKQQWSGTIHKIEDLVRAIRTGKPGRSNLEVAMIGQEIGFGLYESHLKGGVAVEPPIPRRGLWISSW